MMRRSLVLYLFFIVALVLTAGCGNNVLEFASDDGSNEACEYDASKDLNEGNWQDVLDSDCADRMQRGAAYFGLAGYDISDIIDRMIEANDEDDDEDEISLYLNSLVGSVTNSSLTNLKNSLAEYGLVPDGDENKDDADLYVDVFINPIIGLSTLKGIIDPDGDGLDLDCDNNGNDTPDEVDAASCALLTAAGTGCGSISGVTADPLVTGLSFAGYDDTYDGLEVTIAGSDPDCATDTYRNLLTSDAPAFVAVTTSDDCTDTSVNASGTWSCPFEEDNEAINLISELTDVLNDADDAINDLVGGDESEIEDAIEDLRDDICGDDGVCDNDEVSDYLQNL